MKSSIFAALCTLSICAAAAAQETDDTLAGPELAANYELGMEEAPWEWRPGDLIFRNGINEVDEAMKRTLGLTWATVGILHPSSGGPRVIFVDQANGVTRTCFMPALMGWPQMITLSIDQWNLILTTILKGM